MVKQARLELKALGGMKLQEDGEEFIVKPKGLLGRLFALTYELYDEEELLSSVRYGLLGKMDIKKDGERVLLRPMGTHQFEYNGQTYTIKGKRLSGKFEVYQNGSRVANGKMDTQYGYLDYWEDFDLGKEILVGIGIWAMSWYTGGLGASMSGV
jgi:hypothetical protein